MTKQYKRGQNSLEREVILVKAMAAFVFKLHGASRAYLTSQWRNLAVG